MKRLFLSILLSVVFLPTAFAADYSGKCGENLTWSLDVNTGVLTISGTGPMDNYDGSISRPWNSSTIQNAIKSIIIEEDVTSIGNKAFESLDKLTSVSFPKSLTTIGEDAFSDSDALESVNISGNTTIDYNAFKDCDGLKSVMLSGNTIVKGQNSFQYCDGLKDVIIGGNVKWIGEYSFSGCDNLSSVIIEDGITSIPRYSFYDCPLLSEVILSSTLEYIGASAFEKCISLKKIQLPNSLQYLAESAFAYSGIEGIIIPVNTEVGRYVFSGSKLETVTVYGINQSYNYSFNGCRNLRTIYWNVKNAMNTVSPFNTSYQTAKIYFGDEVDTIPDDLCDNFALEYIEIGKNVKHIGEYAFCLFRKLDTVLIRTYAETPPSIESYGFSGSAYEDVTVIVPCNSVVAYKESSHSSLGYGWEDMIIVADEDCLDTQTYTVTVSSANTSMGTVSGGGEYEEGTTATVTATPKSGYRFTKWSDGTTKNPYTFTVTKNVTLTAYFEKESSSSTYEITCEEAAAIAASLPHNTPTTETYTVIGYVTETDGVISREQQRFWMADTPNGGNVFQSYWGNVTEAVSVGDKVSLTGQIMRYNSTYQIKNGDVIILAYGYSPEIYTVSVSSSNTSMGTVSGGGEYEEGTTATVTATPKSGYKFTKWSDGTTKNPYTFTVNKDISLTAYFENESSEAYEITCEEAAEIAASLPHNTPTTETYTVIGYVTETDGVISREQQRFWMADIQGGGNVFQSYWGNVTEAVAVGDKVSLTGQIMRYNSTYQIKNGDVELLSRENKPKIYTVTVSSDDTSMGTVSGGGEYEEGTIVTVTATPKNGYTFFAWNDCSTMNPYTFTVTEDIDLIAYFDFDSSIEQISCEEAAAIAASLPHNTPTTATYTVIGYVTETDGVISRNQQRFWMADYPDDENVFQCYWGNVTEVMNVGDKVAITGQIMRYNSTYQIKNGDVVRLSSEEVISCEEAVEFVNTYLQNNESSASIYNVVGYVTETDGVISRGQQRFWMDDIQGGSKVFQCYWGNVSDTIKVGDYVSVRGHLMRYNSTAQIKNGDVTVLSYGTGVDDVVIHKTFDKILLNGQLLILRDGKTYTIMGLEL